MSYIIQEETDLIIIKRHHISRGLALIVFGVILWLGIKTSGIGMLFGGIFFLLGLFELLVVDLVTIDKKSEKIIIKEKSNIIEEICFSDINRIEIKKHFSDPDDTLTWKVNLVKGPFQGGFTTVYYANSESEAERISKKISKITNREIVRRYKK